MSPLHNQLVPLENSLEEILSFAELPVPVLGDLSEVTLLAQRLHRGNPAKLNHTYSDICNLDTIEVNLVPEKKGIFLKHVEYQVTSKVLRESVFSFVKARRKCTQCYYCNCYNRATFEIKLLNYIAATWVHRYSISHF